MVSACHTFVKTRRIYNRVNWNVNYGCLLIIMYEHWLINCKKKCPTLMQDVNNRGNFGLGNRCEGVYGNSILCSNSL